ncbi:uncharacterized protein N7496_010353 [Penicillium cataractarum]|uniref:SWIM-type domain-containing protein n=1 Tax=Penicillium cataractarum TaxID=2100454 RepID=A0A9W9RQN8_9EURO|nr:uncharacterized protein N7496_010353 [Penicillium cataractarum]KAJ5364640.1 hypothetical protein N7496_010353 [Penicillium cataractarum]
MDLNSSLYNLPSSAGFIDQLISELSSFQPELPTAELDPPRTQITHQPKQPQNALSRLPALQLAKVKPLLLTLHCLFPNDLLPALDILDRRLVQRIGVRGDKTNAVPSAPTQDQTASAGNEEIRHELKTVYQNILDDTTENTLDEDLFLFLVTSASSAPVHPIASAGASSTSTLSTTPHTSHQPQKVYEVRLNAWNCTCPTFILSAFRNLDSRQSSISNPNAPAEPPSDSAMLRDRDDGSAVYPFGGTLTCTTDRASPPACKHILACVLFARCPLFSGGGDADAGRGVSMEEMAGWCAGWGG